MALTATMRRFEIALADSDRELYETLELRVAQHPSESERYLVARVLARALEHAEGVDFTRGLAADDEPALWQRDLRGDLRAWIEVGLPAVERLHRAAKASPRVAVYGWRNLAALLVELRERNVHKVEQIELYALAPEFLDAVAATLDRTNRWDLAVTGGALYLGAGGQQLEGAVTRVS
jgi:uncharacterized protein YaeQ